MQTDPIPKSSFTRRRFLQQSAAASTVFAVPSIIPASALGRGGAVAPSERIVMGGIGINSRGSGDLNWMMGEPDVQFVAICDVRRDRREAVKRAIDGRYGTKDCTMHRDIREFLELAAEIKIKPEVQEYALEEANIALMELKERKIRGAKVLKVN